MHPRRREFARARLSRGRRTTLLRQQGEGLPRLGCRWQRTYRLRRHVGPGHPRARASEDHRRGEGRRRAGDELRYSESPRGHDGAAHPRAGAERGESADDQFGHRGVHERGPAGARCYEARQDHQVRWLLSRPRGFAAGQGRLRRADFRPSGQRGCARVLHAAHHRGTLQRQRGGEGGVCRERGADRRHHSRTRRGQCGLVCAAARLAGVPARDHYRQRRAADIR